MRLAEYTDYTLRVLMYCAARPGQLVTIRELAEHHGLSRNHLMKIVTDLGRQGVLETARGRGGGLRLLQDPATLRIATWCAPARPTSAWSSASIRAPTDAR